MRVIFFDHVAVPSGGEIALLNLIRSFNPNLVEAVVVLGEEGPLVNQLREYAEVHILPMREDVKNVRKDSMGVRSLQPIAIFGAAVYVYRLASLFRKSRADLVHTNSLKADLLGGFAAKLNGLPLIWHIRDRITADYLPPWVAATFQIMSRCLPDLIIANSHATAATLSRVPKERIRVVHDGTTFDDAVPVPLTGLFSASYHEPVIGLVGRISPWKGQDVFVRAASLVVQRFPRACFRIIGAALFEEREYEESLYRLVEKLHLQDAVTFEGFCQDVQAAIGELDIVVHASKRPEPFGQVIIEGMAAARAVIAINAGGVPEIMENAVTGLLVQMDDPEDMARAICALLEEPEAAQAMGLRARAHIAKHFTMSRTVAGVTAVYQELRLERGF